MERHFLSFLGVLALLTVSCSEVAQPSAQEDAMTDYQTLQPKTEIPGEYILEFDDPTAAELERNAAYLQTKSSQVNSVFESMGVVSMERVFPDAGEWEPRHRAAGLHKFYRVRFDHSVSLTKAGDVFTALPGVESAEPVRVMRPSGADVFDDPYLPQQWQYYNKGFETRYYTEGIDINVVPVWKQYTGGRKDVIVAVIDDGVDMKHPDLAAVCIPGGPNGSKNFVYDNTGYVIVGGDHGTHVAGTIAAINNNGIGCCGVAGGLDGKGGVSIMSCQIFMDDPLDPENTLQGDSPSAMVWAADHGAVISQNSWSYVDADGIDKAMASAIDYFVKNAGLDKNGVQTGPMKGGVVFFSAGNESTDESWPPQYENVTAVGAINSLGNIAYYSNYGSWVDICAPGGDMNVGPAILSTCTKERYDSFQGTSMACPHVSGVAALLVSYFGGPGFTNEMLLERLYGGANHNVPCADRIGPLVDALGAFTYGGTTPPAKVSSFDLSQNLNSVTLKWKATEDPDDGVAHHYLLLASKDKSAIESFSIKNPSKAVLVSSVENGDAKAGDELTGTVEELDFDSVYYVAIMASDYSGNCSEISAIRKVTVQANNPPVITCLDDVSFPIIVKSFEKLSVKFGIEDPEGHSFKVSFDPASDAASITSLGSGQYEFSLIGRKAPAGKYDASFSAEDKYGASTNFIISYEILENHAPKVVKDVENILLEGPGDSASLKLSEYIVDEDGEPLTIKSVATQANIATAYSKDENLIIEGLAYGVTDITVTATDAAGKSCSTTFKVAVRDPSVPVSLYPNPVSTVLNVSTVDEMSADIRIVNKAGATVRELSQSVSPFAPVAIDMNDCPAGVYSVVFKGGSIDGKYTIVKK